MPEAKIVKEPLDVERLLKDVKLHDTEKRSGAIVLFIGVVKGLVSGERVDHLDYEVYEEEALRELNRLVKELSSRDKVIDVRIYHRIGRLRPGEDIVYIVVSAVDRETAFSTAWEAIDRLKHEIPIWKKEVRGGKGYWVLGEGVRVSEEELKG